MATLKDDMVSEVSSVLLNTDEMGEAVTYYGVGAMAKSISATVLRSNDITQQAQQDGLVSLSDFVLTISSDATLGVVSPKHGDKIALSDGRQLVVVGRQHSGRGSHLLTCQLFTTVEKSDRDYRITR